jgi:UPF0176 protein
MFLYNRVNADELRERIQKDPTPRTTLSFYRYVIIKNPQELRNKLFADFSHLGVLGRIYIAREGINAQMSLPAENLIKFRQYLDNSPEFSNVPFKIAVEDDGKSFFRLTIKVRNKIVADGLDDEAFDVTNVGTHLDAESFNQAMELPDTIVVDMRNHYESEVGRFEGAICPDVDSFREELPWVAEQLKDNKDHKILMYCTGGIRCEKASAYLRHHGFKDVNQLHGGIIAYAREIREKGMASKFHGKNFVFDERMGERITDEVISHCHQCGETSDQHVNCANLACNLLFIQCNNCSKQYNGCCSNTCIEIVALPEEKQKEIRKNKITTGSVKLYQKGRMNTPISPAKRQSTINHGI